MDADHDLEPVAYLLFIPEVLVDHHEVILEIVDIGKIREIAPNCRHREKVVDIFFDDSQRRLVLVRDGVIDAPSENWNIQKKDEYSQDLELFYFLDQAYEHEAESPKQAASTVQKLKLPSVDRSVTDFVQDDIFYAHVYLSEISSNENYET